MPAPLTVPTLPAGSFRLRPFILADVSAVREASSDPYIPLVTTMPAAFSEEEGRLFIERQWNRAEHGTGYSFAIADAGTNRASILTAERAGFQREGLLRSWQEVDGTRRDMYMYARLPCDPVPPDLT